MKHLELVVGAALVSVVIAALAADPATPEPFKIEVQLGDGEAKMRCVTGCTWATSSYACGPAKTCSFSVDEMGVKGM